MAQEIHAVGENPWELLSELHALPEIEIRVTDVPDSTQLNNQLASSKALAVSVGLVFLKLGQNAVLTVRDILVKHIASHHVKLQVTVGKNKVSFEGALNDEQRNELITILRTIAAESSK